MSIVNEILYLNNLLHQFFVFLFVCLFLLILPFLNWNLIYIKLFFFTTTIDFTIAAEAEALYLYKSEVHF